MKPPTHLSLATSCRRTRVRLLMLALGIVGVLVAAALQHASTAREILLQAQTTSLDDISPEGDKDFPGGAALKTDPELERLLKRADQFVEEGRFDLACVLWQRVLDESAETVITRDEWLSKTFKRKYRRYRTVAGEIEQTIAGLPPAGLRMYRLNADPEAQAVLAEGKDERREEALSHVARRFFMSSHGDDAAFELACIHMDRYDFVGASRLLTKLLSQYPEPSVSREDIELRLAIAAVRVGDRKTAQSAVDALASADSFLAKQVKSQVRRDLESSGSEEFVADAATQWPMHLGNSARTGHMKPLPAGLKDKTLSEMWVKPFEVALSPGSDREFAFPVQFEFGLVEDEREAQLAQRAYSGNRSSLISRWRQNGWRPTGQVLMVGGLVYYKSCDRVVCRDLATGELAWMGRRNQYQIDKLSQHYSQQGQVQGRNLPRTALDVMLFADQIHQGMTLADGRLYAIEGDLDGTKVANNNNADRRRMHYGYNSAPRRARRNFLAAYDAKNGKLKWHRSAAGESIDGKFDIGYLSAPTPHARFLILPVSDNGALWLQALDRESGKLAWSTFLCEDPMSAASPFSPIAVAVDGGDAYISTGAGAVFAVDALSGTTRWAVRYQRSGGGQPTNYQRGHQVLSRISGWHEDMVIPHGKALVVMASDSDELFAVDRRTGEFLWESPRVPSSQDAASEYCLGVVGDSLYVAGKDVVRRYDIKGGRMKWEAPMQNSLGRGALTADSIYMPEEDSVVRIDLAGGKRLSQVNVFSSDDGNQREPVGNLFTDGRQLLAYGLGRVYALTDLSYRLESLAQRIKQGDTAAQLERMRLRMSDNDREGALADLKAAYGRMTAAKKEREAVDVLFSGMTELAMVDHQPQLALQMVAEAPRHFDAEVAFPEELGEKRRVLLYTALEKITDEKVTGAVGDVLNIAPLCDTADLESVARMALAATATKDDAAALKVAIKHDELKVRTLAMSALDTALGEEAKPLLREILDDPSESLKIEAALALANSGERVALETLGDLLDSEVLDIRLRSVRALRNLTGEKFQYSAYEKADDRLAAASAWRDWIKTHGEDAQLKPSTQEVAGTRGRTLICYYSQHKLVELDGQNREVWSQEVRFAWGCQGLPNGHRLVASYSDKYVAEFDKKGNEVWRSNELPGGPFSVERLANGNTLAACTDSGVVVEISPEKEIVWKVKLTGRPASAERLDNGNTLISLQTDARVVEVNPDGEVVWEVNGQDSVLSATRLDNGNTLICRSANNVVIEVDRETKREVARIEGLRHPYDAQRLPDGNTLIVDFQGVHEYNAKGELVWQQKGNGASRIHRY